MRRPSRQGLLPLWTYVKVLLVAVLPQSIKKAQSASFRNASARDPSRRPHSQRLCPPVFIFFMLIVALASCNEPEEIEEKPSMVIKNMKNKVLHLCITLAVLNSLPHWGYAQATDSILSVYFGAVRSGNHPAAPAEIFSADHYQSSLSLLGPYVDDSITIVSAKACEMVHSIASRASASEVRRGAVEMLLGAWRGQDIGINGMILEYLKQYSTEDFTGQARDSIRSLVRKEPVYFDRILKLAGFLQLDDLIPEIRPWTQPGNPTNLRWAAYLSLARMGDHAAIQDITERVKRLPVNDDVVYQIFPDLVYTRQQVLIALMVEALQNDARNCLTADPERDVPIPCGYRIMEQLAGIIAGYPFVRGESGDLNAKDYPEALRQIRAWFLQHKTYTVLTDTY